MRVFFAQYAHVDPVELRKAFKKAVKVDKSEVIQAELCEVIKKHKRISLTRLRKELAAAYKMVHESDGETSDSDRPMRKYNQFFKEQSAILKEEMAEMTQTERVKEIARRWKAQKELEAEQANAAVSDGNQSQSNNNETDDEVRSDGGPMVDTAEQARKKKSRRANSGATPTRVSKRTRAS